MKAISPSLFSLSLMLAATPAAALSLGEIALQSRLGEPLRAEIPLVNDDGRAPASQCFALSASSQGDLPAITSGSLHVVRHGGVPRLQIQGRTAINEPVFVIAIKAGCGYELQREYVLMPDAPMAGGVAIPEPPVVSRRPTQQIDEAADTPAPSARRNRKAAARAEDADFSAPARRRTRTTAGDLHAADRLVLGAPEAGASTATSEALTEMNERMLRMETTLHTLNDEISKLDEALAAAAQKAQAEGRLNISQTLAEPPQSATPGSPPQQAANQPQAAPWLELLLSTLIGGALTFGSAMGFSRWQERRRQADWH